MTFETHRTILAAHKVRRSHRVCGLAGRDEVRGGENRPAAQGGARGGRGRDLPRLPSLGHGRAVARQRNAFVEQAAEELGLDGDVVKKDLGHVLLRLEALQDEQIRATLQPSPATPTMTDGERAAAMDLLRDPKLVDRIVADFDRCGVVGESDNAVVGYLAATSPARR